MPTTKRYSKSYSRTTFWRHPQTTRTNPTRWNTTRWAIAHNTYKPTIMTRYTCTAPAYRQPRTECEWRIGSYHNVYNQFTKVGKQTCFSPTTANKWIKYVNNGWRVYQFSNLQFTRNFGSQLNQYTPTACLRWMRQKYGPGIKAITRGNRNTWLVAATPSVSGRPFRNYNWNW